MVSERGGALGKLTLLLIQGPLGHLLSAYLLFCAHGRCTNFLRRRRRCALAECRRGVGCLFLAFDVDLRFLGSIPPSLDPRELPADRHSHCCHVSHAASSRRKQIGRQQQQQKHAYGFRLLLQQRFTNLSEFFSAKIYSLNMHFFCTTFSLPSAWYLVLLHFVTLALKIRPIFS